MTKNRTSIKMSRTSNDGQGDGVGFVDCATEPPKTEVRSQPMPKQKPRHDSDDPEQDQLPRRHTLVDQVAGVAHAVENADPQVTAVGDQTKSREKCGKICP